MDTPHPNSCLSSRLRSGKVTTLETSKIEGSVGHKAVLFYLPLTCVPFLVQDLDTRFSVFGAVKLRQGKEIPG